MTPYNECDYSLFISYAHKDDSGHFGWVKSLRDAIWQRLDTLGDEIPRKDVHFSGEGGAVAGTLGSHLRDQVAKSFGMLLVVGKHYVNSDWCEKELSFFLEHFGNTGANSRLYIAAMSETAIEEAQKGTQWKQVMPSDQIWVPMFDDQHSPLPDRMADGTSAFPFVFLTQACRIADRLVREIEKDYKASEGKTGMAVVSNGSPPPPSIVNLQPRVRPQHLVIGPHTASLAPSVTRIKAALESAGAEVTILDRNYIDDFDPDDNGLRPELAKADVMVVPLTLERPLAPGTPGGHTHILKDEWLKAGKAERDLVWFRPPDIQVESAAEKHLDYFRQLAPVCSSETALMNHIFGVGSGRAIRVHVEKHPREHAFKRLIREIEAAWKALPPDPSRPGLYCMPLDLDALATASQDVAGVVLLLPVELKELSSLKAQIDRVERSIPKDGSYPGCVAVLYNPPLQTQVPRHRWLHVQVERLEKEPKLKIEDESKADLEDFLIDLWERYRSANPPSLTN